VAGVCGAAKLTFGSDIFLIIVERGGFGLGFLLRDFAGHIGVHDLGYA